MARARNGSLLIGLLGFIVAASQAFAADQGITGKKLLLKSKPKMVLLSKDASIAPGSDPRCVAAGGSGLGGSVTLHDGNNNTATLDMPCENWSANTKGTLYKYKDKTGAPKVAKLKAGRLKVKSWNGWLSRARPLRLR